VQLQILGSGGPGNAAGRASSAYLIWVDGVARIMVDTGSGTKDQFHLSGADLADIELIALSHLHPDHSAELPAILWPAGGNFQIAGPSAGGLFPAIDQFLAGMFDIGGVYPVLGERTSFEVITVPVDGSEPSRVWRANGISVLARSVPHGDVPTLSYRIDIGQTSIAFTSDQNGSDPSYNDFVRDVDLLVIHLAAAEDVVGRIAELHAKPSVWGQMATAANAAHTVVSHISTASSEVLAGSLQIVRDNYDGMLTVAEDLMCVELDGFATEGL